LLVTTVTRYPHPHRLLLAQLTGDSGSGWWLDLLWLALMRGVGGAKVLTNH